MITAGVKLKLQIPLQPLDSSASHRSSHCQLLSPEQGRHLSLFAKNTLTLETAKRIWSSYPPINIGHSCCAVNENALGLRLGTLIQSSNTVATGVIQSSLHNLDLHLINATAVMHPEPEPGEILDGPSDTQNNLSQHRVALDQARLILADSFLKTLKIQDPRNILSREDVFQNYVAPINERQLDQLVIIGKDVCEDLTRSGKMDEMKRKLSVILEEGEHHGGRRVKRRSEATLSHIPTSKTRMNEDYDVTPVLSHPVILAVSEGRGHASTIDATFDLPECVFNAADRWAKRLIKPHFTELHIQIFFCSILKSTVENIYSNGPTNPLSSSVLDTFSNVETDWPPNSGLFVSLNHEHLQNAGTWTPRNFIPKSPRLDITNYVVSGRNTMRIIQLQDYSSYIFFILALPRRLNEAEIRHCQRWEKSFGACQPGGIKQIQLGLPK